MKRLTKLLTLAWAFLLIATMGAYAQNAVTVGSQVTAESDIVSGKAYVLKTGADRYITDNGTNYDVPNTANSATEASVYYLISNGDGTWKIKNYYTQQYWGVPVYNTSLTSVAEASAGAWSLNFSGGIAYPSAPDASSTTRGIDRSGGKVHSWTTGTNDNHKVYIYKIGPSTTALAELADKDLGVSSEAAASLTTGQWYTMFDRGANHGYLYDNNGELYNTNTVPSVSGTVPAKYKYLVRLVSVDDSKFYVQTGLGNYFDKFTGSTTVPTTGEDYEQITIAKIASTDGHFYLQSSSSSVILDANVTTNGDATVVGWGTTVPSSTGGNNDWAFYPVTLYPSLSLTTSDVYTINNTNSGRGAMTYDPTKSTKYVYSSGKVGATAFDATSVNCQWVFIPTGTAGQYYLYNVGADKFAIPSSTSSTASWVFSNDAVAVQLFCQSDGTYKIKTATSNTYAAVSNGYEGPIINYNDEGGNFTITKVDGADYNVEANSAVARLVDNLTPLTAVSEITTDMWVAVRIKTHGTYADKYIYPQNSTYNGTNYALSFDHDFNKRPSVSNVAYYTHMKLDGNMFYWQLPDGRYLYGSGNKYPIASYDTQTCSTDYTNNSGFRFWGSSRYAVPYLLNSTYFIGETSSSGNAYYDVYPIDPTAAGLTPWKVIINGAGEGAQLTCNRSDVSGLTSVYNNGWFFLPTGTTPTSSDFTLDGMISCTVDDTNYTITAEYDPSICLLADDVAVIQGNQTTGIGNTMQALLRVKATPFAAMTPTAVSVTLTNYDQLDNVAVYVTTDDELHAESASPVKIGEAAVNGASMTITTSSATALTAGTTYYLWITGDVKSTATEWGTIDAAITNIAYTSTNGDNALDVTSIGNPDGVMRIYKQQAFLWTPSNAEGVFYRIPTMITTDNGGIVALADYRHDHPYDLGKNASNGTGNHVIDVVSRRSTDGGLTWQDEVFVAQGDGTNTASYGYGDPAIVKDANGTLHCFMAAGANSYSTGMLHMGYSKSTDNGATWTTVTDIYNSNSINKSGLTITSAFTTAGTGVTFSNGRMAFAMLGKVNGTTNIYPLYSDDNGATWTISPTVAYAGGDESKFEIMNDNSLLVSVRKGGYNGTANRAHNRTTGDASGTGIDSWGTSAEWTDMNANGCNADIIYYNRSTDDTTLPDVMLHTLTKSYGTTGVYRQDLRLYMSVDEGESWSEIFQLQPGSAAYSSMLKLSNGDLAIIFEDGSIGNRDQQDCYAINYVVISKELLVSKFIEVAEGSEDIKVVYGMTGEETYGSWSGLTWTSNASSGLAGVTMTLSDGSHNYFSNWNSHYNLAYHPATASTDATITLTVPSPYLISGYSFKASKSSTSDYTVTVTPAGGSATTVAYANSSSAYTNIAVANVNASSTTFTVNSTDISKWLNFADFTITVVLPDRTVNFQNTATSAVTATATVSAGTSTADCIAATPRGNLSPLVTYGDVVYDFSTNTYTVPYTVQTSSVASPTWYYARLRGTKFMSYDPMAEVLSGYGHPVTNQMTTFGNEYLWAFEGDPYVGVKIYNNAAGTNRSLASATKANNEYLHFVENGTTTFLPSAYNGGLVFKLNDENLGYLNDVNGGIGRWNSSWGATDDGSTMTLTALTDAEELASYIPDALTNYVSQYFTGNVIGAVGDFSSQTDYNEKNLLYQQLITMGSSVTVSYYQMLMTAIHGALTPLTTGNYRLVNVSTGKYLGFNEAFHVRGYTAANGTNANEGYSETGQTLSTIWHVDVNDEGTTAAPVITNSGYYLDAVTSLEGASAGDLVVSAYPLSYAIGVNGAGAIFSSGDNITAAATGNTYNNAGDYDHNTTDNGSYRIYATAPARWRLIPASQTDITITGNAPSGKSYATLYVPFDCTIATENTTAYKLVAENVDDANSRAYLTQLATYGEVIPAGTGVVLINTDAATTLTFTPCNNNTATAPTDNVILGTYKKVLFDSDAERTRDNTYIFGRGGTSGLAGFYQPSASVTKLNANRCYIIPATGGSTVGFALFFDDSPVTGIGAAGLVPNGVQMPIYDLQGRRVAQPQKGGVYIVNGKKVML